MITHNKDLSLEKQAIAIINTPHYVDSIKHTLKEALIIHNYPFISAIIEKLDKCTVRTEV